MNASKPLSAAAQGDIQTLQRIARLMQEAQREFESLPETIKAAALDLHNENYSLNHCIRWGAQNSEEVLNIAKRQSQPEPTSRRMRRT